MRICEPQLSGELRLDPGQPPVDVVVRLVPTLCLCLRNPSRHLAPLLFGAAEVVVQEQRNVAVDAEGAAALFAPEDVVVVSQRAATDRATHDLELGVHRASYDNRLSGADWTVAHSRLTALGYRSGSEESVEVRLFGRRT